MKWLSPTDIERAELTGRRAASSTLAASSSSAECPSWGRMPRSRSASWRLPMVRASPRAAGAELLEARVV
ncbi:hypothetical protein, partial [Plesiocystis pacifica]|uniref:hypothetical protein n=1 Tax=Plesiocystis pacifica TaxID=191768 RepID=UPI0005D46C60